MQVFNAPQYLFLTKYVKAVPRHGLSCILVYFLSVTVHMQRQTQLKLCNYGKAFNVLTLISNM